MCRIRNTASSIRWFTFESGSLISLFLFPPKNSEVKVNDVSSDSCTSGLFFSFRSTHLNMTPFVISHRQSVLLHSKEKTTNNVLILLVTTCTIISILLRHKCFRRIENHLLHAINLTHEYAGTFWVILSLKVYQTYRSVLINLGPTFTAVFSLTDQIWFQNFGPCELVDMWVGALSQFVFKFQHASVGA